MDKPTHYQSSNLINIASVAVLFFLPSTSQAMIALVLIGIPAVLIIWCIGVILGRVPMLLAIVASVILIVVTMVRLIFGL